MMIGDSFAKEVAVMIVTMVMSSWYSDGILVIIVVMVLLVTMVMMLVIMVKMLVIKVMIIVS